MAYTPLRFRISGIAPLIMRSSILADPLHPLARKLAQVARKRMKTDADHELIARIEWYGSLWSERERLVIPAEAIEATFIRAARTRRLGRTAATGLFCPENVPLQFTGPASIDDLWNDPQYRLRVSVRVNSARTMRTRPILPEWSATVAVMHQPHLIGEAEVLDIFRIAGEQCGLGDWRPRYGRFSVSEGAD